MTHTTTDPLRAGGSQTPSNWTPAYERWRHGGWYVTNVHYPTGACGCVSNNYDDKKWRIVCDQRPGDHTYHTRDAAARAEYELTLRQHEALAPLLAGIEDPQLRYSGACLIEALREHPNESLDALVAKNQCVRKTNAQALHAIGTRFLQARAAAQAEASHSGLLGH